MRIVMDVQGAQSESRYRGIGRYTLSLAMAVVRNNRGHDIHLMLNGAFAEEVPVIRQAFEGLLPQANIHVFHVPLPLNEMEEANARAEQIREAAIAALAPDVVHVSSMFEGYADNAVTSIRQFLQIPTVVTFYDMIPWIHRNIYLDPVPAYRKYYERKLTQLRCADALVAISENVCAEAVNVLGYDAKRVFNISAACDPIFVSMSRSSPALRMVTKKFGLDRHFILYSGGADERKNLRRLIDAYALLEPRQRIRCRLVIAGRMPDQCVTTLLERAAEVGLKSGEVIFTGYISDHDLVVLYNLCCFFVFPSWHEGFGLPVLEAMSCGAAVLASNLSSIPEVLEYPAALFDPFKVDSMRERMAHFLDHDADLDELRSYCFRRARDFSWDAVAHRFLEVCEQVGKSAVSPDIPDHDVLLRLLENRLVELSGGTRANVLALADAIDRSVPPSVPKIMIDVTELALLDARTGIQRVTRAIVSEWQRQPPDGYVIQLVRMDRESCTYMCANVYAAQFNDMPTVVEDTPLVCHSGDVFLGLDLVGECIVLLPDWFQYFRNAGVRIAFVIYDILPVRNPAWWPLHGAAHHERWLQGVVGVSDVLLCISRATADDVLAWMEEQELKRRPDVRWFHLGADIQSSLPTQGVLEHEHSMLAQLNGRLSFLMVGTLEPRKGYAQILRAFEQLWAANHDVTLVIVGKAGWLVEELCKQLECHVELNRRVFWLVDATDELLERLYLACSCLIAASEGEGFGLPLIEAAQRQLPVIARDIPVFREVAGEYAAYFSGTAPEDARDAILAWLALYREQRHPRSDVMSWLTWRESALDLATVLFEEADRLGMQGSLVKEGQCA